MKTPTNTKTIVLVTLSFLLVVGAVSYSAYLYQSRKPAPQESYSQLKRERDNAIKAVAIHDGVNAKNLATATEATAQANAKTASVCTSLKTTKVTNPICL